MTKGLMVWIYRSDHECSNNGVSAHHTKAVLTGPAVPEIVAPNNDMPEIELKTGNLGHGYKIVPKEHGKGAGPMFGGCFIYSSDSRFPTFHPIALHDRWESKLYA